MKIVAAYRINVRAPRPEQWRIRRRRVSSKRTIALFGRRHAVTDETDDNKS